MSTRADLIETVAGMIPTDDSAIAVATEILDMLLPQVTTAEQLRQLPKRTWLLGAIADDPQLLLRGSMDGKHLDRYLSAYGPLTVWQPRPDQETRADA